MSTDPRPFLARPNRQDRFRRVSTGLILILAVIAGGLGMVNALQGPRLISAEVNLHAVTARAGQRLTLHINQPLSDKSPVQVNIFPAAPNEVTVDQNTVTIRFPKMLRYNTAYTVTIEAHSAATGIAGSIDYSFATTDVDVYSLLRDTAKDAGGQDLPDKILRNKLADSTFHEVVYESPRIQSYVVLRDRLGVVTLNASNVPSLFVISPADGNHIPIDIGGARTVEELHVSDSGDLFGYILDDESDDANGLRNELFLYDLSAGSGVPVAVTGIANKPLTVIDWMFVPGTTSVVVQDDNFQLFLIDALAGTDPTPLGWHAEMRGFIPGTSKLVVADPESGSVVDLTAGTTAPLKLPELQTAPDYFPGKLELLTAESYVMHYLIFTLGSPSASALVLAEPAGGRELFKTAAAESRIGNFCVSPNGEFLAVEVISGEGVPDYYPSESGYSATSIFFVRIDDATSNRGVTGFLPHWCNSNN